MTVHLMYPRAYGASSGRVLLWSALAVLAVAVTAPAAVAQGLSREQEIYVSVVGRDGAPVTGLETSEFDVREDGVPREVLRAGRATTPMHIALLVDNSQAASGAIRELREALSGFVREMDPQHEIALVTMGDRPAILVDYTRDRQRLEQGVRRIFAMPGSGTYLLDTIVEVSQGFRKREPQRPVIVAALTEGPDLSHTFREAALRALGESGAAMHALVLTGPADAGLAADTARERNQVLAEGTKRTGGRRDNLLSAMGFEPGLRQLAAELSNQYLVVYARPEALIPPERLEVRVTRPDATARSRTLAGGR